MVTTDATIEALLVAEGGYFDDSPRRQKRKSGSHAPVARNAYIKPKELKYMTGKGELAPESYQVLTEILADRARPRKDGDLIACVSQDFGVTFVRVSKDGTTADVYADYCVGNTTAYAYAQKLLDRGFSCTVWGEKRNGKTTDVKLVECDPAARTAAIFAYNFADPVKARTWAAALTGLGYDVTSQGF
ncbi:hypothetical protein KY363_06275 [Candidatus Woesearchaeota archaeon]|nr:hypothetical protein [Candidatus Woesearchaeota archaeon]